MAEKLWNMLKLLPSMSASRRNSLITGLARIDENTEELILSLYHLPDPGEFVSGNDATYYAWFFDRDANEYKKIGELQRKNGLTFGFRKKLALSGDGVFITVEPKGREIREPGMVVLASNPELFYQDLQKKREPEKQVALETRESWKPVTVEKQETEQPAVDEKRVEKVAWPDQIADPVHVETEEIPAERSQDEDSLLKAIIEPVEEEPVMQLEQEIPAGLGVKPAARVPEPVPVKTQQGPAKEDREEPDERAERLKRLFTDFYSDLPGDEVLAMIKNRYQHLKDEVDLREYWEKGKKYAHDFFYETKLYELWEEMKKDLKALADKLGFDHLWERIEKLIMEIISYIEPRYWMQKIKGWLYDLDMHEWYEKGKKYVNAILAEVNPVILWARIKEWLDNLLERMNIDEIMIWVQIKLRQMRSMTWEQMKAEMVRLCKDFVDAIKLPELKMAVVKVTIREKLDQVGNFFQKVKGTVEKQAGEEQSTRDQSSKPVKKMNPHSIPRNPQETGNIYSNPRYQGQHPGVQGNQRPVNQSSDYVSHMNPYNNPYIFKPAPGFTENPAVPNPAISYGYPYLQPAFSCPYMNPMYTGTVGWPCNCCGANWNIGFDALGNPRYLYGDVDDGYYFITPDGEMISRS